jgi:hypothetical protein
VEEDEPVALGPTRTRVELDAPAPGRSHHRGSRGRRRLARAVSRASVDDQDLDVGRSGTGRRHRPRDEGLFVERGYDDGQASHLELGTQASTPGARDTPPRMSS